MTLYTESRRWFPKIDGLRTVRSRLLASEYSSSQWLFSSVSVKPTERTFMSRRDLSAVLRRAKAVQKNGAAEPFKANANLVLVPVTVTDQKDRVVIGVEKDNFSVFDGQERQVLRHL